MNTPIANLQEIVKKILTPPLLAASLTAWMIADNKKASEFVNKDIYKLIHFFFGFNMKKIKLVLCI